MIMVPADPTTEHGMVLQCELFFKPNPGSSGRQQGKRKGVLVPTWLRSWGGYLFFLLCLGFSVWTLVQSPPLRDVLCSSAYPYWEWLVQGGMGQQESGSGFYWTFRAEKPTFPHGIWKRSCARYCWEGLPLLLMKYKTDVNAHRQQSQEMGRNWVPKIPLRTLNLAVPEHVP